MVVDDGVRFEVMWYILGLRWGVLASGRMDTVYVSRGTWSEFKRSCWWHECGDLWKGKLYWHSKVELKGKKQSSDSTDRIANIVQKKPESKSMWMRKRHGREFDISTEKIASAVPMDFPLSEVGILRDIAGAPLAGILNYHHQLLTSRHPLHLDRADEKPMFWGTLPRSWFLPRPLQGVIVVRLGMLL